MTTTILPAQARKKCPDPMIEAAFARVEALCPFPDLLLEEAQRIDVCISNSRGQAFRAKHLIMSATRAVKKLLDDGMDPLGQVAPLLGVTAYLIHLQQAGTDEKAVRLAIDVNAAAFRLVAGKSEDVHRELWSGLVELIKTKRELHPALT